MPPIARRQSRPFGSRWPPCTICGFARRGADRAMDIRDRRCASCGSCKPQWKSRCPLRRGLRPCLVTSRAVVGAPECTNRLSLCALARPRERQALTRFNDSRTGLIDPVSSGLIKSVLVNLSSIQREAQFTTYRPKSLLQTTPLSPSFHAPPPPPRSGVHWGCLGVGDCQVQPCAAAKPRGCCASE